MSAEGRRCRDRRAPWRFWVPSYVMARFASELGPNGLALYFSLAWHTTREAPIRWPSLADLARSIGCSRSTVERMMRKLRALGLLETAPCLDAKGQHSNYFDLVDPEGEREALGQGFSGDSERPQETPADPPATARGMPLAGAVPMTGAPRPNDGGAPSLGRGGAVTGTARTGDLELEKEACANGAHTRAPAAPTETPPQVVSEPLADLFLLLSPHRRRQVRADIRAEAQAEVEELLRRGWTAEQLRASIQDPARAREEWPRVWRARLVEQRAEAKAQSESAAERAERIAQERAGGEAARAALLETEEGRKVVEAFRARLRPRAGGNP